MHKGNDPDTETKGMEQEKKEISGRLKNRKRLFKNSPAGIQ